MVPRVVFGDLFDQAAEALVNPWNRNLLPWRMQSMEGVAGELMERAGREVFDELWESGPISLGGARATGAGRLPQRMIIHVASTGLLWGATEESVRESARSAMGVAHAAGVSSVAFPMIGAGGGGLDDDFVMGVLRDELLACSGPVEIILVRREVMEGEIAFVGGLA